MGFWTAIAVISLAAIITEFVIRIVRMSMRHAENMERMKRGYPTLEGTYPIDNDEYEEDERSHRLQ